MASRSLFLLLGRLVCLIGNLIVTFINGGVFLLSVLLPLLNRAGVATDLVAGPFKLSGLARVFVGELRR